MLIASLKWFTLHVLTAFLIKFILPESWHGFWISVPVWILAFAVAFGFAEWAFKLNIPDKKTMTALLIVWMIVSLTLQILQAQFILGSVLFVINSIDIYAQYILEILAIFLAARAVRKRKINSILGEGMEA